MARIKFTLSYDDQPDDCVDKINLALSEYSLRIVVSQDMDEDDDTGNIDYYLAKII